MAKKSKGKRMAMGGMGMSGSPSDGVTNYMPRNRSGVAPEASTPMPRGGRPSFMGGNPGRGLGRPGTGMKPPSMGRPTTGGELPPIQNMGPDNMGSGTSSSYPVTNYPGVERPMSPPSRGGGVSSGLTPVNDKFLRPGTQKTPAIMPEVATPMPRGGMRGGGLAKKGVGMALKKGGLVKGAGCAKRGVKKPRYT